VAKEGRGRINCVGLALKLRLESSFFGLVFLGHPSFLIQQLHPAVVIANAYSLRVCQCRLCRRLSLLISFYGIFVLLGLVSSMNNLSSPLA
jgi:hypothetical protein